MAPKRQKKKAAPKGQPKRQNRPQPKRRQQRKRSVAILRSLGDPFRNRPAHWPDTDARLAGLITSTSTVLVTPQTDAQRFSCVITALPHPKWAYVVQYPDAGVYKTDAVLFQSCENHGAFGVLETARVSAMVRCCGIGVRVTPIGTADSIGGRYIVANAKPFSGTGERSPVYWASGDPNTVVGITGYPIGRPWQGAATTRITNLARTFVWVPNKMPEFIPTDSTVGQMGLSINADGNDQTVGYEAGLASLIVGIDSTTSMTYQVEIQHHWEVSPTKPRTVTFRMEPSGFNASDLNAVSKWICDKQQSTHVEGIACEAGAPPGLLRAGYGSHSRPRAMNVVKTVEGAAAVVAMMAPLLQQAMRHDEF